MTDKAAPPTTLAGLTGVVSQVTADQGVMMYKSSIPIVFNFKVLNLPDTNPTVLSSPLSLLSFIRVGDTLHYDAMLIHSHVDPTTFIYQATRIWFPKTKAKAVVDTISNSSSGGGGGNNNNNNNSSSLPVKTQTVLKAKDIRKILKQGLKNGPLPLQVLFISLTPECQSYFHNSLLDMRHFIVSHAADFCLADDIVYRISKSKTNNAATPSKASTTKSQEGALWGQQLVTKCVTLVKLTLKSHGPLSLQQLYDIIRALTVNDPRMTEFICTSFEAFRSFLQVHSKDFLVAPHGMVSLKNSVSPEEKRKQQPPQPPQPRQPSQPPQPSQPLPLNKVAISQLEMITLMYIRNMLQNTGQLLISNLHEHILKDPSDMKMIVGKKKNLTTFLLEHKDVFKVLPDDSVMLAATAASSRPLTNETMVAHKNVDNQKSSIKDKKVLLRNENMTETRQNDPSRLMPTFYRGVVVFVNPTFGFVKRGQQEVDNIFFDRQCYMGSSDNEPVQKLNSVLAVGDSVDCLYMQTKGGKHSNYRAAVLWKVPCETESSGIMVSPVTVLPSPVLFGDAKIVYLMGDVGYMVVRHPEAEGTSKDPVMFVTFHLKIVEDPQNCCKKLKVGDDIKYVATQKSCSKEFKSAFWNIISLWPSQKNRKRETEATVPGLLSVKGNLREMTSEGGDLTFGFDTWAHRVSFRWEQVLSHFVNQSVFAKLNDTFWGIVKNDAMMGVTKWVAVELLHCTSNSSELPPRFSSYPRVPLLTNPPITRTRDSGLGASDSSLSTTLKNVDLMDQSLSDIFASKLGERSSLGDKPISSPNGTSGVLMNSMSDINDEEDQWVSLSGEKSSVNPPGDVATVFSKTVYGGELKTADGKIIPFNAHSFYFDGRPISHMVVDIGSQVHFNAHGVGEGGLLEATQVWMGKEPPKRNDDSNLLNII